MAERSIASSEAAGLADFSSAIKRMGMLVGVVRSATGPGTNENPVIAPPVLRLTSAVTCCHSGLPAGLISSPHLRCHAAVAPDRFVDTPRLLGRPRTCKLPEDRLDLRIAGVVRVLEQHGAVLRVLGTRADNPLQVDIGD